MKRRPLSRIEWLLLISPLMALALVGAWWLWRERANANLLQSVERPLRAFGLPSGEVVAWAYPAAAFERTPRAASTRFDPVFLRWNVLNRKLSESRSVLFRPYNSTLSPDGKHFAVVNFPQNPFSKSAPWLEVRDVDDMSVARVRWRGEGATLAWTPDNRQIVACSGQARVYDATTGRLGRTLSIRRWLPDGASIHSVQFSPDGRLIAVREGTTYIKSAPARFGNVTGTEGDIKGRLLIASWPSGVLKTRLPGDLWDCCAWTNGGRELLAVSRVRSGYNTLRAQITRYDLQTQHTRQIELKPLESWQKGWLYEGWSLVQAAFSPDGRFLVAATDSGRGWLIWNASTGQVATVLAPFKLGDNDRYRPDARPQFSFDGRFFLRPRLEGVELVDLRALDGNANQ